MHIYLKTFIAVLTIALNVAFNVAFNMVQSPADKPSESPDVKELTRLENIWNDAHMHGDADALEALWADDSVLTVPGMPLMTKSDAIGALRSAKLKFKRYETSDIRVRIYNDSAVVTGRLQRTREIAGRESEDDWRFTKVYVRRSDKWLVVAWHGSPIVK